MTTNCNDGDIVGFLDAEVVRDCSLPGAAGEIADFHLVDANTDVAEALVRRAVELLQERSARVIVHVESADRPDREPWE
jgi:hypothetical protein